MRAPKAWDVVGAGMILFHEKPRHESAESRECCRAVNWCGVGSRQGSFRTLFRNAGSRAGQLMRLCVDPVSGRRQRTGCEVRRSAEYPGTSGFGPAPANGM
jgi:hypothetical protein